LSEISKRIIKKNGHLLDMCMTNFNTWLMYKDEKEIVEITTVPIYENNESSSAKYETHIINVQQAKIARQKKINNRTSFDDSSQFDENGDENNDDEDEDDYERLIDFANLDLKESYLKLIFEPFRFSRHNILQSLGILRHSVLGESDFGSQSPHTNDEIREIIVKSIEREVQNHPSFANITEEEFMLLNSKCWSKFYTMLKQYDFESRLPLGLFIDPNNESQILLIRKVKIVIFCLKYLFFK
jgi:hypothetical protein